MAKTADIKELAETSSEKISEKDRKISDKLTELRELCLKEGRSLFAAASSNREGNVGREGECIVEVVPFTCPTKEYNEAVSNDKEKALGLNKTHEKFMKTILQVYVDKPTGLFVLAQYMYSKIYNEYVSKTNSCEKAFQGEQFEKSEI